MIKFEVQKRMLTDLSFASIVFHSSCWKPICIHWVSYLDLNNWPYVTWCPEPLTVPACIHSVNEE